MEFKFNGKTVKADVPADTPLLWFVREELKMTGSKFGCGKALCGACTMHLDGQAVRTCVLPISAVADRSVQTIEGLGEESLHPIQKAWIKFNVPQCGYCQSGQIMQAVSYLESTSKVTDEGIDSAMNGNICRCGTYNRIKQAIKAAAAEMGKA